VVTSVEILTGNQRVISTLKGRLGTILRPGGRAEPVEVGVLRHFLRLLEGSMYQSLVGPHIVRFP
jgi:hypothetical protein